MHTLLIPFTPTQEGTMKKAKYGERIVDANEGVDIKESEGGKPDFKCVECNEAARVHRSSGRNPAHFEHLERNDYCSQVHGQRKSLRSM